MSQVLPINLPIRQLLSADGDTRYAVPKYQRNFEWKKEQAEELWSDMSEGQVFLGTIVLNSSLAEEQKITTIVDGQQRLTTISILLAACRVRAHELGNDKLANEIQRKLSFVNDTDATSSESKLITSKSIKSAYELTIANSEWMGNFDLPGKKHQTNKIKPIYEFFTSKLCSYSFDELSKLLGNIYSSNFVAIYIDSDEEAFEIFERTNARGLDLNAAELLKNYFYSEEVSDDLDKVWDEVVSSSNGNMLRLIKYYYVSKFGFIQKKELFRALKKLGKDKESGPAELFNDLREFSNYYFLITAGSETDIKDWASSGSISFFQVESNQEALHTSFAALSLFKATQIYPLLIALMRSIGQPESDTQKERAQAFLKFTQAIEKFLFVNYAVSQRPGNEIELFFADKCRDLALADNPVEFMANVVGELRKKRVGYGEFTEKFSSLSYESHKSIAYYFYDRISNWSRAGGERIKIYNPDHKLLRKNFDCDHIVPQNYSKHWPVRESLDEVMHSFGNILVVARHTNGAMNDILPDMKFDVLKSKQSHLPHVETFISDWQSKNWTTPDEAQARIRERTNSLSKEAFERIWAF